MNRVARFGHISALTILAVLFGAVVFSLSEKAYATSNDTRAVIRSSLLSDPRTAALSQADLDAMVDLLALEAQKKGLTDEDIVGAPAQTNSMEVTNNFSEVEEISACDSWPPLCRFNAAFGFDDQNSLVPVILIITSLGMVWILAEVLHMRSRRTSSGQ